MSRTLLLAALPLIGGFALFQRRRWVAVVGMGLTSFLLAVVYALQGAPDVAAAEAAIGAALVTFVYVLAIRRTGRLIVMAPEVPGLLGRQRDRVLGLEQEILDRFAREIGLDLTVQFGSSDEARQAVASGAADLLAGGYVAQPGDRLATSRGYLRTRFFELSDGTEKEEAPLFRDEPNAAAAALRSGHRMTVDLARFLALTRLGLAGIEATPASGEGFYRFAFSPRRVDLRGRLDRFLERLEASGELQRMAERHLRGVFGRCGR
ncbi:MAG: DUF4040 domain-containing protein [Candidatus Bipolaricaulota bacterium]|nr:MAG: DUF4040 domain-containing protein [Candidatus Bipolaricaulota bacterium]